MGEGHTPQKYDPEGSSGIDILTEIEVGDPAAYQCFANGFQSWSPSFAVGWGVPGPRPADERLRDHFWRGDAPWFDEQLDLPGVVQADGGLLAVDVGTGEDVAVFSGANPLDMPVIRAVPRTTSSGRHSVQILADRPCVQQTFPGSLNDALNAWAAAWPSGWGTGWQAGGEQWTARDDRQPPSAWCSWYSHRRSVDFAAVDATMDAIEHHQLPVHVLQYDDGYFGALGDWSTSVRSDLGSLEQMAARVTDRGYTAGLWLCPTLADVRSEAVRRYPELWVPGVDAPFGSRRRVRILDVTNPAGADYLTALVSDVVSAGYGWLKFDFLFTAACGGPRASGADPLTAYREALRLLRQASRDAITVGCGAPVLASVLAGLTALRTSPDVGPVWHSADLSQPAGESAVLTGRAREFLRTLVRPDPDTLMVGPEVERREDIAAHVEALQQNLRVTGDRLYELDEWGLETTRRILSRTDRHG